MVEAMSAYTAFARVYDELMSDTDYESWAGYIKSFLSEDTVRLLECACGTGELSVRLAEMGYSLTALDNSADMLRLAAQKLRQNKLNAAVIEQSMTDIKLHRPVCAIICACDGVNYLSGEGELESFLCCAYKYLKPGGILLFDTSSYYKLSRVLGMNTFAGTGENCSYIWQNCFDPASSLIEMELTLFIKNGGMYDRYDERHVQRAYKTSQIKQALKDAHFINIEAYEAFTRREPGELCERIQYIAVKPGGESCVKRPKQAE